MHDVCHVEYMTQNMARLVDFYREVFGWKKTLDTPTYAILSPKVGPGVGIGPAIEGQPRITNYILVKDIAATLACVRAHDLEVVQEKIEVPNMGWFGLFKDPDGNLIGLWTALPRRRTAPKKTAKKGTKKAAKKAKPAKAAKKSARGLKSARGVDAAKKNGRSRR